MQNTTFSDIGALLDNSHLERGRLTAIAGLQHNFKTGLLVESLVRFAYDNPKSKEDEVEDLVLVTPAVFESMVDLLTNYIQKVAGIKPTAFTLISKADFISGWFLGRGYHFVLLNFQHMTTTDWTMSKIRHSVETAVSRGAGALRLLAVDDLREIVPHEDHYGYRMMIRELRIMVKEMNATGLFNQPLNSDAASLLRTVRDTGGGVDDYLKDVAKGGYYEDSPQLAQEIDGEIYIHIARSANDKTPYLAAVRGKNRVAQLQEAPSVVHIPFDPNHTGLV